jgi:hypothetical protein
MDTKPDPTYDKLPKDDAMPDGFTAWPKFPGDPALLEISPQATRKPRNIRRLLGENPVSTESLRADIYAAGRRAQKLHREALEREEPERPAAQARENLHPDAFVDDFDDE